jgi:SAM-dependent MidA family methyltransferase
MNRIFRENSGGVSFEAFMTHALHDPGSGYYSRSISTVGGRGDFTTTAEISPALAAAVASWAAAAMKSNGCRTLIELGPGSGKLAEQVWRRLPMTTRWRSRHLLVESSANLQNVQKSRRGLRHARWHRTVEEALSECDGRACLYSNEFFDAFPVRILEKSADVWQELYVGVNGQGLIAELLRPVAVLPDSTIWQVPFAAGQRVEVHQSVQTWLEKLMASWRGGAMLGIDYGAEAHRLYQRRPKGTIRAYLAHQRIEGSGIYQNIGLQDLTADVNFSDLMAWSESSVVAQRLQTQADFLSPFADRMSPGDHHAIDPAGAGGAFQVWQCTRNAHH